MSLEELEKKLVGKKVECAQKEIFILTGLTNSDIDEIIKIKKNDLVNKGGFGGIYRKIYKDKEYAVKYEKYSEDFTKSDFERELAISLILTANENTRQYVPFTFGGKAKEDGGYIVMEMLSGIELGKLFFERGVTKDEKEFIVKKLQEAIAAFHKIKIAHLDLSNIRNIYILLDNNKIIDVVILDFNASILFNLARNFSELADSVSESPIGNINSIQSFINSNVYIPKNTIKNIWNKPKQERIYSTLKNITNDEKMEIQSCKEEIEKVEKEYNEILLATYNKRGKNWLNASNNYNKSRIMRYRKRDVVDILNKISNDDYFTENMNNILYDYYNYIFKRHRKEKIFYQQSRTRAVEMSEKLALLLFQKYNENIAQGLSKEEALHNILKDFNPEIESEKIVVKGNTAFVGGYKVSRINKKKNKNKFKTMKKKRKNN